MTARVPAKAREAMWDGIAEALRGDTVRSSTSRFVPSEDLADAAVNALEAAGWQVVPAPSPKETDK